MRFDKALTKNRGKPAGLAQVWVCTESKDTQRQGHFGKSRIPALLAPCKPQMGTADPFGNDGEEAADAAVLDGGRQGRRGVGRVSDASHCPINSVNHLINLGRMIN